MLTYFCFREETTGRWMADSAGQTWTNLPSRAYKRFRIDNPVQCWAVMEDFPTIWTTDTPLDDLPRFERIRAIAHEFCDPRRSFAGLINAECGTKPRRRHAREH